MSSSSSGTRSDGLKNIAIGAMTITIVGLVLIVAALIYTLETYTPEAKLIFPPYIEAAYGQEQEEQQQEDNTTTTFQSITDGIRIQVPSGWVVEDIDNIDPNEVQSGKDLGWELLVVLCPQSETLPKIGGGIECSDGADDNVWITRYPDLKSRPEFAALVRENKSITPADLLPYINQLTEELLGDDITDFRLLENIDRTVNVTDLETNQTIATAPAKYVEVTYSDSYGIGNYINILFLVLSNDGNTGYFLLPSAPSAFSPPQVADLPPVQQQILDSFELLRTLSP